jgi:predicted site-specific integrase-resolvase
MPRYLDPAAAAEELGISRSTITRCKQMGFPVRYIGTTGTRYRVDPDALSDWMNEQGQKAQETAKITTARRVSIEELRRRRHMMCG